MRHTNLRRSPLLHPSSLAALALLLIPLGPAAGQTIVAVLDAAGDGAGNVLEEPTGTAVDGDGNLFVAGFVSRNAFQVTPDGTVTEIVDSGGDGSSSLRSASAVATDSAGNVYVSAEQTNFGQVFQIETPGACSTGGTPCTIRQIIDTSGDGSNALYKARALATDADGNVYVVGFASDNVFRIAAPSGCSTDGAPCTITEIIDSTGDGTRGLDGTYDVAVDAAGNVYVVGIATNNVFKISTPGSCSTGGTVCTITEIIDDQGDGAGNLLNSPINLTVDGAGNVYVTAQNTHNAFRIEAPAGCSTSGTPCTITEIIDSSGDGTANGLAATWGVAADPVGNVFVGGRQSSNVFYLSQPGACSTSGSPCSIAEVIDVTGDGLGKSLLYPFHLTAYGTRRVYVPGRDSDTVFSVQYVPPGLLFEDGFESGDTSAWSPGFGG